MAYKRTLKLQRRKSPPLPELVEKLIGKSVTELRTGGIKPTVLDLIRMVQLRRKLFPATPVQGNVEWIDRW
jgi:hypothetical protein